MIVHDDKLKCMESFMDTVTDDVEYVHLHGNYYKCDTNYSSVKYLGTTVTSLYLLQNFRNIIALTIVEDGHLVNCEYSRGNWRSNLVLPNMKELYVYFDCKVQLEDLLRLSSNLNKLVISKHNSNSILSSIEKVIRKYNYNATQFVSPLDILNITDKYDSKFCEELIAGITYVHISKIVAKYPNIKEVSIFDINCWQHKDYHLNIEKEVGKLCTLKSTTLLDIIMYAYKVVCIYITKN